LANKNKSKKKPVFDEKMIKQELISNKIYQDYNVLVKLDENAVIKKNKILVIENKNMNL
jgi:hypothetical protein